MGDSGNGHRPDGVDDDWVDVELSISGDSSGVRVAAPTEPHPLVLNQRALDELDAELDGAFGPIDTPPPSDSTSMSMQSTRPPTPLPRTRPPTPLPRALSPRSSAISTLSCPACGGPVDLKSRHVAVFHGAVRVYCSQACLEQRDALPIETEPTLITRPRKSRRIWWTAAALFVGAGCATALYLNRELQEMQETPFVLPTLPALATVTPAVTEPTVDPQKEADAALTAALMHDAWIHPLAGPTRRMPVNHNGAFGAERGGERPPECVSGHCGVDVGNVWGEHVYAVHDGVIDWVNRGPNEERGGVFVRISHRDGTLFSWYFHLAAVPRWVRPGEKVSAGQVIGLLGDTGVKHSAPHLHFSLSVKTSKQARERYLDPEPLIAIWPLWIPNESRTTGALSTSEPGLPVRANGGTKRRSRDKEAPPAAAAAAAPIAVPASAEMPPATGAIGN